MAEENKININLKDPKAEALLKELRKQEPLKITPRGINMIPFDINTDFELIPLQPNDN